MLERLWSAIYLTLTTLGMVLQSARHTCRHSTRRMGMFIKDLTKMASKEKCKALAERLHKAAKARELSYTGRGYAISIDQAADGDDNVALALGASWNIQ